MQITIQIPEELQKTLISYAQSLNIPLEHLIVQTLQQLSQTLQPRSPKSWPQTVLQYAGDPDFPCFESHRDELLLPMEPNLFT